MAAIPEHAEKIDKLIHKISSHGINPTNVQKASNGNFHEIDMNEKEVENAILHTSTEKWHEEAVNIIVTLLKQKQTQLNDGNSGHAPSKAESPEDSTKPEQLDGQKLSQTISKLENSQNIIFLAERVKQKREGRKKRKKDVWYGITVQVQEVTKVLKTLHQIWQRATPGQKPLIEEGFFELIDEKKYINKDTNEILHLLQIWTLIFSMNFPSIVNPKPHVDMEDKMVQNAGVITDLPHKLSNAMWYIIHNKRFLNTLDQYIPKKTKMIIKKIKHGKKMLFANIILLQGHFLDELGYNITSQCLKVQAPHMGDVVPGWLKTSLIRKIINRGTLIFGLATASTIVGTAVVAAYGMAMAGGGIAFGVSTIVTNIGFIATSAMAAAGGPIGIALIAGTILTALIIANWKPARLYVFEGARRLLRLFKGITVVVRRKLQRKRSEQSLAGSKEGVRPSEAY